ncbi:MAG TPA: hypothetical protein PK867_21965, partial [Pirellulales bacterium]|nr:hypothetical protein [Pirellulales bacterium]
MLPWRTGFRSHRRSRRKSAAPRSPFGQGARFLEPLDRRRLAIELLEDRRVLATFADAAPTLDLTLGTNEALGIVSNGTSYALTVTGGTWTGTDDANVIGNGTATLIVTPAGLVAFNTVSISDAGTGASVAFDDSGANAYLTNFTIGLHDSPALAGLTFNGTSSFGASNLDANVDTSIAVNSGADVSTTSGSITLEANQSFSIDAGRSQVASAGGDITISAGDMTIDGPITTGSTTAGIVTLEQGSTTTLAIDLGGGTTAGDLDLSDADLAEVTAGTLRIGRTGNSGNITVTAPVTTHAGYNTLSLLSGGTVSESGTGAISVTNLAVQAAAGADLSTNASDVGNLAFDTTSGNVQFSNTGPLTIASVAGLTTSSSGGTTTLGAAGPITFAVNTTSAGTLTATTTEPASETGPPEENITVNSGVTVESTTGDVDFTSGDGITVPAGATVKSDSGAINLVTGSGDNDADASTLLNGTLSGIVNLTYDMPANTTLTVDVSGGNLEIRNSLHVVVLSVPLASATSLTVDGSSGETLIIDNTVGGIVSVPTINFDNSTASNNQLQILGGAFTSATYDYASAHDGDVKLVSTAASTINYTNLTPILNTGTATDVAFNLPAGPSQALLEDSAGLVELHSLNATATFEDTTFAAPTGSLTIHRGNPADTLDIQTANLGSTLTVGSAGSPFATVTVTDPLTPDLGAGDLSIHANTIDVDAAINTTAGTTGNILFDEGSALNIAAGANIDAKGSVTQTGAGVVSIGADITTSNSPVSFAAAVTLSSPSVAIDTGTSALTFGGSVTGSGNNLTVTSNGTTTFDGNVSVNSLTASSTSGSTAFGPAVT